MHLTHTKMKHKSKMKVVCNDGIILHSSVHDIKRFCAATNTYININDGVHMSILAESVK